jgi:hypothetical protein
MSWEILVYPGIVYKPGATLVFFMSSSLGNSENTLSIHPSPEQT